VPSYIAETFLARDDADGRIARERRARSAAQELTQSGTRVRFGGVIHVPEDEICFVVFDAPSGRDAALAAARAGLDPLRVVEAVASREEKA
jgi:beta-glucosidase-like glycosyl hydrolase